MSKARDAVRRLYGAHPLHLLILLGCFALVGYVVIVLGPGHLWNSKVWWKSILVWFIGAFVLHDLVLFPFYAVADRSLAAGLRAVTGRLPTKRSRVSPVNYFRVPILGSGLLFLLFFPGIIRQGRGTYHAATGLTQQPFLERWLLITAALFGMSAIVYSIRSLLSRAEQPESVCTPDEAGS
jgi:hypothetical protein